MTCRAWSFHGALTALAKLCDWQETVLLQPHPLFLFGKRVFLSSLLFPPLYHCLPLLIVQVLLHKLSCFNVCLNSNIEWAPVVGIYLCVSLHRLPYCVIIDSILYIHYTIHYVFLNLVAPVSIGTLCNKSPPSAPVTGNPPLMMSADTHLSQHLFLKHMSPCLLWPPSIPTAALWHPVHFSWQSEYMSSQYSSPISDHVR